MDSKTEMVVANIERFEKGEFQYYSVTLPRNFVEWMIENETILLPHHLPILNAPFSENPEFQRIVNYRSIPVRVPNFLQKDFNIWKQNQSVL